MFAHRQKQKIAAVAATFPKIKPAFLVDACALHIATASIAAIIFLALAKL